MLYYVPSWCLLVVIVTLLLNADYGKALSPVALDYNAESFGLLRKTSYPHFMMFHAPWYGYSFLT